MRSHTTCNAPLRDARFEKCEDRIVLSALSLVPLPDLSAPPPLVQWVAPAIPGHSLQATQAVQSEVSPIVPVDVDAPSSLTPMSTNIHSGAGYARHTFGFQGTGQTVAVIDSGIAYDHTALGGGFGAKYRVVGGWDFTEENDANPYDDGPTSFHGTHVAGIIGSSNATYTGVAPGVDLVALRVFNDQGAGKLQWVENALTWVHNHRNDFENPITAVNLSLGTQWNSSNLPGWAMLENEFAQLESDGIFVSVAAGNSFKKYNAVGLSYPAVSPHVVPVASVGSSGQMSDFSQRAARVLAAPGESIVSTVPDHLFSFDGVANDFAAASGTSMAAPYVAGASTLLREAMEFVGYNNITQETLYQHFWNTADLVHDSATGLSYHRLNMRQALDALMPEDDFGSDVGSAFDMGQLATTRTLSGLIGQLDDLDYFTFTAAQTGVATFTASATHDLDVAWQTAGSHGAGAVVDGNLVLNVVAGQTYTVGLGTSAGIGYYDLSVELETSVVDWGEVASGQFAHENLTAGETVYQVTAARDGVMTVEAFFNHAAGNVDLALYNSEGELLASSDSVTDNERLDVTVSAGETVYLKARGSNGDVDFRVTNLVRVDGATVDVFGTENADTFAFAAASDTTAFHATARQHQVTVNGVQYTFDASMVTTVQFHGNAGSDTITLRGTAGNETATLRVGSVDMTGEGYQVHAGSVETVSVDGGGGSDAAWMYGSSGDDTFVATPTDATLSAAGYTNKVDGFDSVTAFAGSGYDVASLYGSSGDDYFKATPREGLMQGDGFFYAAKGFDRVNAVARGGHDVAGLYGSNGDDYFSSRSGKGYMQGDGFISAAYGFDRVNAVARGGNDTANLYGSAGDDYFSSRPGKGFMRGAGFAHVVYGFDRVNAVAGSGGHDVANLDGSSGDDYFSGQRGKGYMRSDGFTNVAYGFDRVNAVSRGGNDTADLRGSSGNDYFSGGPRKSYMRSDGFTNVAYGFARVGATAGLGGNDVARLYDSAGDDTFVRSEHTSMLSGSYFSTRVSHFGSVRAYANAGGNDRAVFTEATTTDRFFGYRNEARLTGTQSSESAQGFDVVSVLSKGKTNPVTEVEAVDYLYQQLGTWE